MISISHSPNSTFGQQLQALRWLFSPWSWRSTNVTSQLEQNFSKMHNHADAYAFSTGREALQAVLEALDLKDDDEVILQAFTCIVVPNAVLWAGAKPVYADIDATLNIDCDALQALITPKTKAIIVQHTFGIPAEIKRILAQAAEAGITIIEDCAHALGATVDNKLVGTFGDAAIFSFGRDKVISSVSGGMAVTKNEKISQRLAERQKRASFRSSGWILQQLLHPLIVPGLARLMHSIFPLGQLVLKLLQSLRFLGKVYRPEECSAQPPAQNFHHLPTPQAALALRQLQHLEQWNTHRAKLAKIYAQLCSLNALTCQAHLTETQPVFLRWTAMGAKRDALIRFLRSKGYLIGNWYNQVIMPLKGDFSLVGYKQGSCPRAEQASDQAFNLPTHYKISEKRAQRIANHVRSFYE